MVQAFSFDTVEQDDLVLVAAGAAQDDAIAVVAGFHAEIGIELAADLEIRHREGKVLQ
jgi:hypothetical protein